MRQIMRIALLTAAFAISGCSTATYQVVQKGTWKVGTPTSKQPVTPVVLQNVLANAPGGKASVIVVYFGADQPPIVEAKGDSSALVEATAAVGRKAIDAAVLLAKSAGGVP